MKSSICPPVRHKQISSETLEDILREDGILEQVDRNIQKKVLALKEQDLVIICRLGLDARDKYYGALGEVLPFDEHGHFYRVKLSTRRDDWDYFLSEEIEFLDHLC
jgi:hypothetical protein